MNTRKLLVVYIAVIQAMVLLAFWISSGYSGLPNKNIKGGVTRLSRFHCLSTTEPNCPSFRPINSRYEILLGDSEAISISDLFINKFKTTGHVTALSGCSFLPASITRESQTQACRNLNLKTMKLLNSKICGNVYIFNRFTPLNSTEADRYVGFLRNISRECESLTVIGSPVELNGNFSAYASMLFKSAIDSPAYFAKRDFDQASLNWNSQLAKRLSNSARKIIYINTNAILVPHFPTTLKDSAGEYLYFDRTHLSYYGGQKIISTIKPKGTPANY